MKILSRLGIYVHVQPIPTEFVDITIYKKHVANDVAVLADTIEVVNRDLSMYNKENQQLLQFHQDEKLPIWHSPLLYDLSKNLIYAREGIDASTFLAEDVCFISTVELEHYNRVRLMLYYLQPDSRFAGIDYEYSKYKYYYQNPLSPDNNKVLKNLNSYLTDMYKITLTQIIHIAQGEHTQTNIKDKLITKLFHKL